MTTIPISCLTDSGLTEAQASAIADAVQASTHDAIENLRRDLVAWHAYLALYLLIQIGIVLLAIFLNQANF